MGVLYLSFLGNGQTPTFNYPSTCGLDILIPDETCPVGIVHSIEVNDLPTGSQLGVDVFLEEVRLVIEHTFDADLDMSLVSPNGVEVILSNDNGSGEENYGDPADITCNTFTALTVLACQKIEEGAAPFIGEYMPQESFYLFNDQSNPNGTWQLKICDDVENDVGTLEFVELRFSSTNCLPPVNVEVTEVDSTTVSLNWEAGGNCQTTIIEYGLPGFTPGIDSMPGNGGTVVFAGCPPYDLEGLAEQTPYDIYIREHCNGSNFSSNSCLINATTNCALIEDRLIENFDNQTLCSSNCGDICNISGTWFNTTNDDFDWLIATGTTSTPETGPTTDVSGDGNYIYLETSANDCRSGNAAYLMSNCIEVEVSGTADCSMSFNYHAFGGDVGRLAFEVSTDGGANWTTLWLVTGNQGNRWHKQYINLNAYTEQVVRFRFAGEGGPGAKGDIALDNIIFYGSMDLGPGDHIFYEDADGDGFGNAASFIQSCDNNIGNGFVANDLDCDDTTDAIHPNAEEIPCNNIDENCNGTADDLALAPPIVMDTVVCSGQEIILIATPLESQADWIFWYSDSIGFDVAAPPDFLLQGVPYTPASNNTSEPRIDSLYAEAQDFDNFCVSRPRALMTVTVMPKPKLEVNNNPEICRGQSFDLSTVNLIDEHNTNGTLTYHTATPADASNQLSSPIVEPSDTTLYFIKSTTTTGCSDEAPVVVYVRPGTNVNILPEDHHSLCFGTNDTLRLEVDGNIEDYFIRWSTNDTMITELPIVSNTLVNTTDIYSVTVTDPSGCQSIDTTWVKTVTSIPSITVTTTSVTTCNGQDASITIEPNGGTPSFNYWLGGTQSNSNFGADGALTFSNLQQGTYAVTVTDSSPEGCELIFRNILVNGPDAQVSIANLEEVSCHGGDDGGICLEVMGDNPTILWENGATTSCTDSLASGSHQVSITDNNCETVLTIDLPQPDTMIVVPNVVNPSCHETADGQIDITVNGGTGPYQFEWSNGALTEDISGLTEGLYAVTVIDAKGCRLEAKPVPLTTPDPLTIELDTIYQITCANADDGRIFISVSGGVAPYSYQWNDAILTEDISSLPEGVYDVLVTDANGCTEQASFEIINPPVLEVLNIVEDASCPGLSDGHIFLDISGGTTEDGDYQITWSLEGEVVVTQDLTNIPKGIYEVVVSDDNGCSYNNVFTVDAPERLNFSVEITPPHCIGAATGAIDLTVTEAVSSFLWNTEATTEDLSQIPVGTYEVDIVAANGCLFDTTLVLESVQILEIDSSIVQPNCNGVGDGSIELFVLEGGEPPYQFDWNNGETVAELENLSPGVFVATITDDDDCFYVTDTFRMVEPELLEIIVEDITHVNCFGEAIGNISVRAEGGVQPYFYILNDELLPSETVFRQRLTDIPAGDYKISIQDANDCIQTVNVEVEQPTLLQGIVELDGIGDCSGGGGPSANVLLEISGGTGPYTYLWSSGQTSANLMDAPIGIYDVSITDANNCSLVLREIKVPKAVLPLEIDTVYATQIPCFGMNNGSLNVSITGGEVPYQFLWSPPYGQEGTTRDTFLTTGNVLPAFQNGYSVTITDNRGCTVVTERMSITQPSQVLLSLPTDSIFVPPCEGSLFGGITPVVEGGLPPYTYTLTNTETGEVLDPMNMDMIFPGEYSIGVQDSLGCVSLSSIEFSMPDQTTPLEAETTVTNILCHGANTGGIALNVSGGELPYQFAWSNGATTQNLVNIPAGTYSVTIQDDNPCLRLLNSIVVEEPDVELSLADTTLLEPICSGEATGSIEVFMSGGTMPYSFFWSHSNNIFTSKAENLEAGEYEINVADANGCIGPAIQVELEDPVPISVELNIINATDDTTNNGSAMLIWMTGAQPFEVLWENGNTGNAIGGMLPGTYGLMVKDANGCVLDTFAIIGSNTMVNQAEVYSENLTHLELHPNPVRDLLYVNIALSRKMDLEVAIYDILGRQILKKEEESVKERNMYLDLTTLTSGTYIVLIKGKGKILGQEIIVKLGE